jgi:hypothetical protein
VLKSSPKLGPLSQLKKKLFKVNNCPKGENSPNLVTLFPTLKGHFQKKVDQQKDWTEWATIAGS